MKRLLAVAALLSAVATWPAAACTWSQIPEEVGDGSAQFLAREMVRAATYSGLSLSEPSRRAFLFGRINPAQHFLEMAAHGVVAAAGQALQRDQIGDAHPPALGHQEAARLQCL